MSHNIEMQETKTFVIVTLEWKKVSIENFEHAVPSSSGLYQIYGWSETYGENALLYVGKSNNLNERLKQHINKDTALSRQQGLSIRYALHEGLETENGKSLEALESILIAVHKPSMNTQNINSLRHTDYYVLVQNHGERGALNIQITNSYWVD
jgi:excinuclease UvrABC nuclease subunit